MKETHSPSSRSSIPARTPARASADMTSRRGASRSGASTISTHSASRRFRCQSIQEITRRPARRTPSSSSVLGIIRGKYLAHVGVRIDPPEHLPEFRPDLVLISNAAFADEIREQASALGISAEFEVL